MSGLTKLHPSFILQGVAIQPKLKPALDIMEKAGTLIKRSEPTD